MLSVYRTKAVTKERELLTRRKQKLEELQNYVKHRLTVKSDNNEHQPRIQVSEKKKLE